MEGLGEGEERGAKDGRVLRGGTRTREDASQYSRSLGRLEVERRRYSG